MSLGASVESWAPCSSLFTADATNDPKGASASGISLRGLGVTAGSANIKNAIASMNEPLGLRRPCSKSRTMHWSGHKRGLPPEIPGWLVWNRWRLLGTNCRGNGKACLPLARTHPGVPLICAFFADSTLASALHSAIRTHAFKTGAGRCHSTAFFRAVSRQY